MLNAGARIAIGVTAAGVVDRHTATRTTQISGMAVIPGTSTLNSDV